MKLAIIDLDGVIADNTARFAKAEEVKQQWIAEHRVGNALLNALLKEYGAPGAVDIYWRTAFLPELVALDTLIEGASEAIEKMCWQYDKIIILSSRPESMRQATIDWFWHLPGLPIVLDGFHADLILKPTAFQFTKTTTWKAGTIQMLAGLYGADELLVVDDEQVNRDVLLSADSDDFPPMRVVASLAEAIAN